MKHSKNIFRIILILILRKKLIFFFRRSIISGSRVQWRLTNFSQNRHGQGTTQNVYSAMPNEGSIFSSLDVPHPDARLLLHFASIKIQCFIKWFRRDYFLFFCRLDWERQFFDENLDNPPNWEFQPVCFFSFNAFLNVELVSVNLLMIIKRIIRQIVTKSFFNFFLSKFFIFTFLWHSV